MNTPKQGARKPPIYIVFRQFSSYQIRSAICAILSVSVTAAFAFGLNSDPIRSLHLGIASSANYEKTALGKYAARHHSDQPIWSSLQNTNLAASEFELGLLGMILPATFTVNDTSDRVDSNAGDGQCRTSVNTCTLRAAIQQANALAGPDNITVPAGTYAITIAPQNDNLANTGDFDITGPVTITGAGSGTTIIDAGAPPAGSPPEVRGRDRLFEIHSNAGHVTISGLSMREGYHAEWGGGIQNASTGTVRLENVAILDSYAGKYGGGINNAGRGRIELVGSTVSGNGALEGGSAINNTGMGTIAILSGSSISNNPGAMYPLNSGAIHNQAENDAIGTIIVSGSTVSGNASTRYGAGIYNTRDGVITIENSTFSGNTSDGNGGSIYTVSGVVTVTGSTFTGNAAGNGAAIHNAGLLTKSSLPSRLVVSNSTFSNNSALQSGAGIYSDFDSELLVSNTNFIGNSADGDGAGISAQGKTAFNLTGGSFTGNTAAGEGGGISAHIEQSTSITGTVFFENESGAGGGLYTDGSGTVDITGSTFSGNHSVEDGGGVSIHSFGTVTMTDCLVTGNSTDHNGGGIENGAQRVTLTRLTVTDNSALENGGGIQNASSGEFTILDSTVQGNKAANGGGFTNASDSTLVIRRSTFLANRAQSTLEDSGYGGGIFSASDGNSLIENTTVSSNIASTAGGGIFHDADGSLRIVNVTIWRNSAPAGGGLGIVESDYVPTVPPTPNTSVILRNTIVAGSIQGGSCDSAITSEGGNIDSGTKCYLQGPRDRSNANPGLDAIADNGGATLTHALSAQSLTLDRGVAPFPETDQRGVPRPQNAGADVGAFEFEGEPGIPDEVDPETTIVDPPSQVSETATFRFSGTDDQTPTADITFECRIINFDPTEPPDPPAPGDPPDPALVWIGCANPWLTPPLEGGVNRLEVRAVDRVGNVDKSPATHTFTAGEDIIPPDTMILGRPANPTYDHVATFTFAATDDATPPELIEFECRIDFQEWELIQECINPMTFADLTTGQHTFQVRAIDEGDNYDPTPATYTWTIESPVTCAQANTTLSPNADTWVDEFAPFQNFGIDLSLNVRSQAVGEDARTLVRFALPTDVPPDCVLTSATLRLFADSGEPGRALQALPVAESWSEMHATWNNQPSTYGPPAIASSGGAYREWDVTSIVGAIRAGAPDHGFLIREETEEDFSGVEQTFSSRNTISDEPQGPQLVLRFSGTGVEPPPPPPPAPVPATVFCGQVITQSTLVMNDLENCPLEGLVIGAPNIELNLGGHTIDGLDYLTSALGQEEGLPAGIRNSGFSNVIIRNGRIQEFGNGVHLTAGTIYNVVENLTVVGNALAGVELSNADNGFTGNKVRNNIFTGNTDGVAILSGSENSQVTGNDFDGNLGVSVHIVNSSGHRIEFNRMSGVTRDPSLGSDVGARLEGASDNTIKQNTLSDMGDAGIYLAPGSHRNKIDGNVMTRVGDAGIFIEDSDGNHVLDNVAHLSSDNGISLGSANDSVVRGNDVRFNPGGISLDESSRNLIDDNNASNSSGSGIALGSGSVNNLIKLNIANDTGSDGIVVEGPAIDNAGNPAPNVLKANTANRNLGSGIVVHEPGHVIVGNSAYFNGGLGISAPDLTADGGLNTGGGNTEAPQCTGVVCGTGTMPEILAPDGTAPDTQIIESPATLSRTTGATIRFTGSDNRVPATALRFECRLDAPPDVLPTPDPEPDPTDPPEPFRGENWESCASPAFFSNLPEGTHTFEVMAVDHADNFDPTPARFTWAIEILPEEPGTETTPPVTTITSGPANPSTSDMPATFMFRGSDNATPGLDLEFECRLDDSDEDDFDDCSSPKTYAGLGSGVHTFEVRAIDRSDNEDPTPATYTWTILPAPPDTTAPETTIVSGPDLTTISTAATFVFSSNEEDADFECSLDGASYADCDSPVDYASLPVGTHVFSVRAVDEAGNVDATPATYSWEITAPPVSSTFNCGQVITQSVIVTNDLVDCLGNGLVVGANSITIDLGGYTIDGSGLGTGILNDGFDSVTVMNGTIQEFDHGILLNPGTAQNIVSAVDAQMNQIAGIGLVDADDGTNGNLIRHSTFANNTIGISIAGGTQGTRLLDNTVGANTVEGVRIESSNGTQVDANRINGSSGEGLAIVGSSGTTVIGNTLSRNSGAGIMIGALDFPSNGNRVEGNTLIDNSGAGIAVLLSNSNEIVNNTVTSSSGAGVSLEDSHNCLVKGNDVRRNNDGIELAGSTGNRIEANNASETSGAGITLGVFSYNNVVVLNTASINVGEGISVADPAPAGSGNVIERNVANSNGADGIHVSGAGHVITANIANDNGNWGMYAPVGIVDGGANRVQDNVTLEQCFGVVCTGTPLVDLTPPETTITDGPTDPSDTDSAIIGFAGTDNASAAADLRFECRMDSQNETDFAACTSPQSFAGVSPGTHTFEVRAIDLNGNVDQTPAVHRWTMTPTGVAPDTTIDSAPDRTTVLTNASFLFSSNEPGTTFECSVDGGAYTSCASPAQYSSLPVGEHQFLVRATDLEGLTDATPASYVWTIGDPPVPTTVSCGLIVTQSIVLLNDLTNCPGNGLVVGAHRITIDLGGRTIDGSGVGIGILNNGFDEVTITNGSVQEFESGLQLNAGTMLNIVSALTVRTNELVGISLSSAGDAANGNTIRSNTVTSNGIGIHITAGSQGNVVRGNALSLSTQGEGIRVESSSGNRLESNQINSSTAEAIGIFASSGNLVTLNVLEANVGGGIALGTTELPASNLNRILNNTINASGSNGITVTDSNENEIMGNVVHRSEGSGIALENSANTLLQNNNVRFNGGGLTLAESSNNRIEANSLSDNNGGGVAFEGNSLNNVLVLNTVSGNIGDGITVSDAAPVGSGNTIDRNTASRNEGDGIQVAAAGHTISANTTDGNTGWGIFVEGSIDGGANRATGNIEPGQCFGVVCVIGISPGAPDTTIEEKPTDPTNSSSASFTYTGVDDTTPLTGLTFQCRLDSENEEDFQDCEYPQVYTGLTAGLHKFEVRALDQTGNVDPIPAVHTWTYVPLESGVPPDTMITLAPAAQTPLLDAIFTFSSNEPDVTYECKIDAFPFETCEFAAEYSFEETELGAHQFQVRAIDIEGNVDPTPAVYNWTIIGAPITTIHLAPEDETESSTATFHFSANESEVTYECSIDLSPYTSCVSPVTYTGLAIGEHVFFVRATDSDGNTEVEPVEHGWSIVLPLDTAVPDTSITDQPAENSSSTTFTFTGTDLITPAHALEFECRLDSNVEADFAECVSPFNLLETFPEFGAGPHIFQVRAVDQEGNVDPTPASYTWNSAPDTTGPETVISVGPPAVTLEVDAAFEFSGTDNATPVTALTFECSLDGGPYVACSSPHSEGSLEVGPHTLQIRAVDLALNADPTPATHQWTVEAPPDTNITTGPESATQSTTADFTFTSSEAGSTFECSLDGSAFSVCTTPHQITGLGGGQHNFAVRAVDTAGNADPTPAEYQWTVDPAVDTIDPETTISSGPAATTTALSAVFEFSSNEANVSFECSLDSAPFTSCSSPHTYNDLAGVQHTFAVRAVDLAGNIDETPANYVWLVQAPPETTIETGPAEETESTTATFTFSSNEPGATFQCALDSATFTACANPMVYSDLAVGLHEIFVRAVDAEGNVDPTPEDYEWEVLTPADTTPPETTINDAPISSDSTDARFVFSSNETATFECSLDGAAFSLCQSPSDYAGLGLGAHTFAVRATDTGGLVDESSATHSWTVQPPADVNPPETTITSQPAISVNTNSATFAFVGSDLEAAVGSLRYECRLDSNLEAAFAACSSTRNYLGLSPGSHTFEVRAIDPADNVDPTPAVVTWTIDTTAPETIIDSATPDSVTTSSTATFTFSSGGTLALDDAGTTFACSLDGAPFSGCISPKVYTELSAGSHSFAVRSVDAAGNADPTPASFSWTIDLTPPVTTINAGPPATTNNTSPTFEFSSNEAASTFVCSLDGSAATACTSPMTYSGLAPGNHTFSVRAADQVGNADATPATNGWMIDIAPPQTTINAAMPAQTLSTTATFSFSSEAGSTFACSLDGAPYVACTSPRTYTGVAPGEHIFAVSAIDLAGNFDASPSTWGWIVDTAPETTISSDPGTSTISTSATFFFSSNEPGSTFMCSLDGGAFAACTSPRAYTGLSVGSHTFDVRSTDPAGFTDATPARHAWTVQSGPNCGTQATTLSANADAWIEQSSPTSNKGTDSVLKVMSKNGGNLRGFVRFNLPAIPQGCVVATANLRIFAASSAGGRTIHASRVTGSWTENSVNWNNQPAANGSPVAMPSATGYVVWSVGSLVQEMYANGNNGFMIRDANENQDAEQQFNSREKGQNMPQLVLTFGLPDTTPPETTITSASIASPSSTIATFAFQSSEHNSTFKCSLDGAAFAACSSPQTYTGLTVGDHTFAVQATDQAGNIDASPEGYGWTIETPPPDSTPPQTTITIAPSAVTVGTNSTFEFASNEAGSTFECSLDGAGFTMCSSPRALTGLSVGSHTFQVRAIDPSGLIDDSPASYTWTIQAAPNCGAPVTLSAVADSWIEQSGPSSNKGTDSSLKVMSKSGSSMRALVRFSLPAVPAGCVLDTANLRLYAGSAANNRTLLAFRAGSSWAEAGVTWANQPQSVGTAASATSGTGYRQWNVAAIVQSMLNSGTNNGFLIRDSNETQDAEQQFNSREKGQNMPQLVLSFRPAN